MIISTTNLRRFRFSLRTLFVVVTVLGLWLFPQLKWILDRHSALGWIGTQAVYWHDMPVSQRTFFGTPAPWQIRILGEAGVEQISVVVEKDDVVVKQRELERLFPEADVLVMTPGPGYVGAHSRQ
jgi:hypothetical protein